MRLDVTPRMMILHISVYCNYSQNDTYKNKMFHKVCNKKQENAYGLYKQSGNSQ